MEKRPADSANSSFSTPRSNALDSPTIPDSTEDISGPSSENFYCDDIQGQSSSVETADSREM